MEHGNQNTIRSFIAIEMSDEARREFSKVISKLKDSGADVKWIDPDSLHLTLKFLGNIEETRVPDISKSILQITSNLDPFEMRLDGLGAFPNWTRPRVVWLGISEGGSLAKNIAEQIERTMESYGFEREKRSFSPHITLGRVRSGKNVDKLKKIADSIKVDPCLIEVKEIILFRSQLTPHGAIYSPLSVSKFKV
ncbi:MAG: RNA 2',3'-cyclic phosphodiesterase [Candidatus Omnitrophica bacterium]|nr:RNA 2',3'-cyclic phosphodiesterase [Candidatus Omnitrophota bacterium]